MVIFLYKIIQVNTHITIILRNRLPRTKFKLFYGIIVVEGFPRQIYGMWNHTTLGDFMALKRPAFITGATAKVKIGTKTMAYAQDVAYTADITTIPIETLGRYEVVSNEPVAYFVSGSLSIIRYTSHAAQMNGAAGTGNGIGNWKGQGANEAQVDPGKLIVSETFDLEVFQKIDNAGGTLLVGKLIDCRFTRVGSGVNKRGVMTETFAFNAILAQDDSFNAGYSGDIDLS
jgi:hypothetical protein